MPSVWGGAPAPLKVLAPPLLKITSSKPQTRTLRLRVDANCQGLPARKQQGGHLPLVDLTPEPMTSPEGVSVQLCSTSRLSARTEPPGFPAERPEAKAAAAVCPATSLTVVPEPQRPLSRREMAHQGAECGPQGPGPREPTNKVAVGPHRCSLETSLRGHQATNPPCRGPLSAGPGWPVERRSGKVTYRPPWPVPLSGSLPSPVPRPCRHTELCVPATASQAMLTPEEEGSSILHPTRTL